MLLRISDNLRRFLVASNNPVAQDLLTTEKTEKGDFLDSHGGFLTYLPLKNIESTEPWRPKFRVRGKPAKIAKNFVSGEHSDRDYEMFFNELLALTYTPKNLSIEKGSDIMEVYLNKMDNRKQSAMLKSCMVSENADASLFELYIDNPEVVRLLVLWGENSKGEKVALGRALLWKTTEGIYLDRAYGSEPATAYMKMYAKNKGWLMHGDLGGAIGRVIIDKTKEYRRTPYLDTFSGPYYNQDGSSYLIP